MSEEDCSGREMTLDEWVESLPGPHRAKRELAELKGHGYDNGFAAGIQANMKLKQARIADLERQLAEAKEGRAGDAEQWYEHVRVLEADAKRLNSTIARLRGRLGEVERLQSKTSYDEPDFLREEWDALPQKSKDFIAALETNADPAGMVRENEALRQNCAGLQREVERLRQASGPLRDMAHARGRAEARLDRIADLERQLTRAVARQKDWGSAYQAQTEITVAHDTEIARLWEDKERVRRFMSKVADGEECWEWQGSRDGKGYGNFASGEGRSKLAHRFSYEMFVGDIPEGLLVCHHCDNPSCVNPDHLFTGTNSDNLQDALSKGRSLGPAPKDACNRGHPMTADNIRIRSDGYRQCRECIRIYRRQYKRKKRLAIDAARGGEGG